MNTPSSPGRPGATDGVKADAKSAAADLKASATDAARGFKDDATDAAEQRARQGKRAATGALGDVAEALHAASEELRDHDRDQFAQYADRAADQVEQFVGSVRDKSVGELLDEAERFARRDPGLFIGGAFLLGVFGARFLKASSPDRFDRRAGGSGFGRRTGDSYRAGDGAREDAFPDYGRPSRSAYGSASGRLSGRADAPGGGRIVAPTGVTGASGHAAAGGALVGGDRSALDNPSGL